jgi:hypothetical protein
LSFAILRTYKWISELQSLVHFQVYDFFLKEFSIDLSFLLTFQNDYYVQRLLYEKALLYPDLPIDIRAKRSIAIYAAKYSVVTSDFLLFVPKYLRNDPEITLTLTARSTNCLKHLDEETKSNKNLILNLIEITTGQVKTSTDPFKKEMAVAFLKEMNAAVINTDDFIRKSIEINPFAILFLSKETQLNPDYVRLFISSLKSLKTHDQLNLIQSFVQYNQDFLSELPRSLNIYDNEQVFAIGCKKNALLYRSASERLKRNGRVLSAAAQAPNLTKELFLELLAIDSSLYRYVPTHLSDDYSIAFKVVKENGLLLKYCHESLRNDEILVNIAIQKNPLSYEFVCDSLKMDQALSLKAIRGDFGNVHFLPISLLESYAFLEKLARTENGFLGLIGLNLTLKTIYHITRLHTERKITDAMIPSQIKSRHEYVTLKLFFNEGINKDHFQIDSKLYCIQIFPEAISDELSSRVASSAGNYDDLIRELIPFVNNWRYEDRSNREQTLEEFAHYKSAVIGKINILRDLLEGKINYFGTENLPWEQKKYFLETIKEYLRTIQGTFRKAKTPNEYDAEKKQIIRGLEVCAGGFLADLKQVHDQICIYEGLSYAGTVGILVQKEALLATEAMNHHFTHTLDVFRGRRVVDVHGSNQLQYDFHHFIGGKRIPKDPYGIKFGDMDVLLPKFLEFHHPRKLIDTVLRELATSPEFQVRTRNYLNDHLIPSMIDKERISEKKEALEQEILDIQSALSELIQTCLQSAKSKDHYYDITSSVIKLKRLRDLATKLASFSYSEETLRDFMSHKKEFIEIDQLLNRLTSITNLPKKDLLLSDVETLFNSFDEHKDEIIQESLKEDQIQLLIDQGKIDEELVPKDEFLICCLLEHFGFLVRLDQP